ncbi:MAG: hypothetical protein R2867_13225 [Caldilineaceae bacterium]
MSLTSTRDGYDRVRFDITYDGVPTDLSVDIGDAGYTDGRSDNAGQPIDTAEIQVIGDELLLYGNHTMPDPLLYTQPWAVANGETLSVEIQNGRVAINGSGGIDVVESPDLFMLDTGSHDQRIYAAFNRSIDGELVGDGVGEVVVTLYPAR